MIKFKNLKKNAKHNLKKNYVLNVLAALIGLFFLSYYTSTKSALLIGFERIQNYYDSGAFATDSEIYYYKSGLRDKEIDYDELFDKTDEELQAQGFNEYAIKYIHSIDPKAEDKRNYVERFKVRDGFIKPLLSFASSDFNVIFENVENLSLSIIGSETFSFATYTAIASIVAVALFRIFIVNVLQTGYARFFLENTKYHRTRLGRIFPFFTHDYFKVVGAMARKTIYQTLWNFTIIGGIIKMYSYKLVPYIVAEDSNISSRDAVRLSVKLMKGYKWKAFVLDLSFLGWNILSDITLGLSGIFYSNPYIEGTMAEFYKAIILEKRKEEIYKNYLKDKEFADELLYIDGEEDYYPGTEPELNTFAKQYYSPLILTMLFFVFAFAGWCMEVALFMLKTHVFVNRGTLYGPWLPIYGIGCVLILIIFTKTRLRKYIDNPIILFLNIMVLCGILEYFTSWILEVTTGLKYWDYSGHFLSINGRICFENLCEFGAGGLLCIYLIAPRLKFLLEELSKKKVLIMIIILSVLFITDNVIVRFHPRTGYGITDSIIDENGNIIDKDGNIIE